MLFGGFIVINGIFLSNGRYTHKIPTRMEIAHVYTPKLPVFCSNSVRNNGYVYMLPLSMTNKQTFRFLRTKGNTVQVRF